MYSTLLIYTQYTPTNIRSSLSSNFQYGDPSADYSITPLGGSSSSTAVPTGPSTTDSAAHLYAAAAAATSQQQYSALNLFAAAGGAYPATPAALMHSAMGPLLGAGGAMGTVAVGGDAETEQLKRDKELIYRCVGGWVISMIGLNYGNALSLFNFF